MDADATDAEPTLARPGLVWVALATALVATLLGWALTRALREPDTPPVDRIELPAPEADAGAGGDGG